MGTGIVSFTIAGEFSRDASDYLANFLNCEEGVDKINFLGGQLKEVIFTFFSQGLINQGLTKEQAFSVLENAVRFSFGENN